MNWRNDQIYLLRQDNPLGIEFKNNYSKNVIRNLFIENEPHQILFLFLKNVGGIRPGFGIHPLFLSEIIGKESTKDIEKGIQFPLN